MTSIPAEIKQQAKTSSPYEPESLEVDIFIVGSGPIGCTFARQFVEAGLKVLMVDAGAQLSKRPGEHLKNSFLFQRNVDSFASVIRGHILPLSVPVDERPNLTWDPGSYQPDKPFSRDNQNPDQVERENLPGAAATYAVGGMATHWTCATPRQHPTIERWNVIKDWDNLYDNAEEYLNTHPRKDKPTHPYEHSIRHQLVVGALQEEFKELKSPYNPQALPLACERRTDNDELVTWSGADTVLKPLLDNPEQYKDLFEIRDQHRCTKLIHENGQVQAAVIEDLLAWKTIIVKAKRYIVCAGTVLTPQILFNSGIRPKPLGLYLSEQPIAFCQVVLKQKIIDEIIAGRSPYLDKRSQGRALEYYASHEYDPIPIPLHEPEPQGWIPISEGRLWHCQIHRDAFSYGDVAPNVDNRLIVDLRWFGRVEQSPDNKVTFSDQYRDSFGMPQPTFKFDYTSAEERNQMHDMMEDMLRAAGALGGFLPPSEPQFMPPGLTLHIHGPTRMGTTPDDSVVDEYSKVWDYDNLYLGGNSLLPVANASNPTLTSVAVALHSAKSIIKDLNG
ncbi:MAG: pyranose oxidase [Cyanobacteria bacterium J06621_8]